MGNVYARELKVPLPQCCNLGSCCKGASPSTPYKQLWERAAAGDDFARGFFSIMVPYASHQAAEAVVPGIVSKTLQAAQKQAAFESPNDVAFYHCRYQTEDNRCGVWEDRPQFCRDYPDTPFVVMAPGCAFEPWAKTCKEKYHALKEEMGKLKDMKLELKRLKSEEAKFQQHLSMESIGAPSPAVVPKSVQSLLQEVAPTETLSILLSLTSLYVTSPLQSAYFIR